MKQIQPSPSRVAIIPGNLVHVSRNDVFTDSMIIAQFAKIEHDSVRSLIKKHELRLEH